MGGPTHVKDSGKVLGGVEGNLVGGQDILGMQTETFEGGIADRDNEGQINQLRFVSRGDTKWREKVTTHPGQQHDIIVQRDPANYPTSREEPQRDEYRRQDEEDNRHDPGRRGAVVHGDGD